MTDFINEHSSTEYVTNLVENLVVAGVALSLALLQKELPCLNVTLNS